MRERIDWIDQVKGFAIFLVVYGHNFPSTESYIYSFHMPLFFMISGFFFPRETNFEEVVKRFKSIVVPYFAWSFLLFVFWFFIGRNVGESKEHNLSPMDNFFGIFYAQGGREYMDWGIPMWFLPSLFLCFCLYFLIKKYFRDQKQIILIVLILSALSFAFTRFVGGNLFWSINVSMVALLFFAFGNLIFPYIGRINTWKSIVLILALGLVHFFLYDKNTKIDMYRSIYGNEFLFFLNGITASICVLLFFRNFPKFPLLSVIGNFTLLVLALQLLSLSGIKLFLLVVMKKTVFDFSETEKFLFAIIQIGMIYPVFLFVNKYIPFLNGGFKKT